MVDSEIYWTPVAEEIWQSFGAEFDSVFLDQLVGLNLKDSFDIARKIDPDLSWNELLRRYDAAAVKVYGEQAQLLPGVLDLVKTCAQENIQLGIASSSSLDWVNIMLRRFQLSDFFKVVLSTRTLNLPGKPDPAVYLEAMKELQVTPAETIVFEDSIHGVTAAKRADAFTVAVPNPLWNSGDYSIADLVLDSLEKFDTAILRS